jgi:hypothetical protein
MKHKLPEGYPKEPWTSEKIQSHIDSIQGQIKLLNQQINFYRSKEREIYQMQIEAREKMSNKQIYLNQLKKQIENTKL